MVLIENEINNWRIKVYGEPAATDHQIVYYRVIEEPLFSETGDCVMIVSNHPVSLDNHLLTPDQAHSLIPVFLGRHQFVVHDIGEPVKYISFTLPRSLKTRLMREEIENQAGMIF